MKKEIIQKIYYLCFIVGFINSIPSLLWGEEIQHLWTRRIHGAISELRMSKNGKVVLVPSSPDRDILNSAKHYQLTRIQSGKVAWEKKVTSPIKELAVSEDGSLSVMTDYSSHLSALDSHGKMLWTVDALCKPFILASKKILCYHDDDADPKVAFDVFTESGKKEFSYPIETDVLALKIAADDESVAVGLGQGEVVLFSKEWKLLWKKKVDGEIIDVAVSSGKSPLVSVLYQDSKQVQKIAILDSSGEFKGKISPTFRAIQIETTPKGGEVFYYGNGLKGQWVGMASIASLQEVWKRGDSQASDFSHSIDVGPHWVTLGYEEHSPSNRRSHVTSYDLEGKVLWDVVLSREDSAYLYAHRVSADTSVLVVGTDDAQVSQFSFK